MKVKRPRIPCKISVGQVVGSTNPIQYACCRVLVINQTYNSLTYERINRFVKQDET